MPFFAAFSALFLACLAWTSDPARAGESIANHYRILGLESNATEAMVRGAYLLLVKKFHPDRRPNDPGAKDKFVEIQAAYDEIMRFQEDRRERLKRLRETALELGRKYARDAWPFDAETLSFYDHRTNKSIKLDELTAQFRTAEGWQFNLDSGKYYDEALGAEWDPENTRGWFRSMNSLAETYISIDPRTGFSLSVPYEPVTVSDASALFDDLFNPVRIIEHERGLFDRDEVLRKIRRLSWTEEQTADFLSRARAHQRIYFDPTMGLHYAGHKHYKTLFLNSLVNNSATLNHPELIKEVIEEVTGMDAVVLAPILVQQDWLDHPKSLEWIPRALGSEKVGPRFIAEIFMNENQDQATRNMKSIYPQMMQLEPGKIPLKQFIHTMIYDEALKGPRLAGFGAELDQVARSPAFARLIAEASNQERDKKSLRSFVYWYRGRDLSASRAFEAALDMRGADIHEFYRQLRNGDTVFREEDFRAAKEKYADARLKFLRNALPEGYFHKPSSEELFSAARKFMPPKPAIPMSAVKDPTACSGDFAALQIEPFRYLPKAKLE